MKGRGGGRGRGGRGGRGRALPAGTRTSAVPGINNTFIPGLGLTRKLNLRYCDTTQQSGSFTAGGSVWNLSGLFDPRDATGGGQPIGFDQIMAFFEHYTVTSARIKVSASNLSVGKQANVYLTIHGDNTMVTDFYRLGELGKTKQVTLQPVGVQGSIASLEEWVSMGKFMRVRDVLEVFEMRGDVASNPVESVYAHVMVNNPVDVTSVAVAITVTIEFAAVFTEPRDLTRSLAIVNNRRPPVPAPALWEDNAESKEWVEMVAAIDASVERKYSLGDNVFQTCVTAVGETSDWRPFTALDCPMCNQLALVQVAAARYNRLMASQAPECGGSMEITRNVCHRCEAVPKPKKLSG